MEFRAHASGAENVHTHVYSSKCLDGTKSRGYVRRECRDAVRGSDVIRECHSFNGALTTWMRTGGMARAFNPCAVKIAACPRIPMRIRALPPTHNLQYRGASSDGAQRMGVADDCRVVYT